MTIDWPSVLPVWTTQVAFSAVIIGSTSWIVYKVVRTQIANQMRATVEAVARRLDASNVYAEAAAQHTKLQQETELDKKRFMEEHRKKIRDIIREELAAQRAQMTKETATVVGEVRLVPDATAEKVASRGTGDSHHG